MTTEIVEKVGRFLKVRSEKGLLHFLIEEREGGLFSMTFDEWDELVPAVVRLRKKVSR